MSGEIQYFSKYCKIHDYLKKKLGIDLKISEKPEFHKLKSLEEAKRHENSNFFGIFNKNTSCLSNKRDGGWIRIDYSFCPPSFDFLNSLTLNTEPPNSW